jgi:hypothetical protein
LSFPVHPERTASKIFVRSAMKGFRHTLIQVSRKHGNAPAQELSSRAGEVCPAGAAAGGFAVQYFGPAVCAPGSFLDLQEYLREKIRTWDLSARTRAQIPSAEAYRRFSESLSYSRLSKVSQWIYN